jgi:hypothetical protein
MNFGGMMKLSLRQTFVIALASTLFAATAFAQEAKPTAPSSGQPPNEISAGMGSCRVLFTVTDLMGKPIYDAQIKTTIHYGFLGKRRLSLQIGTNADGRARFVKMPDEVRNPLEFQISHGSQSAIMTWDPGSECDASYPVLLGGKDQKQ